MNRLRRIIEGVWMAAGNVTETEEQRALRELFNVARQKIDAINEAVDEARALLSCERKEAV